MSLSPKPFLLDKGEWDDDEEEAALLSFLCECDL